MLLLSIRGPHLPWGSGRDLVLNAPLDNNPVLLLFSAETASLCVDPLLVPGVAKGILSYFYLYCYR